MKENSKINQLHVHVANNINNSFKSNYSCYYLFKIPLFWIGSDTSHEQMQAKRHHKVIPRAMTICNPFIPTKQWTTGLQSWTFQTENEDHHSPQFPSSMMKK